ncbi:MAG: hypothetical protein KBD63_06145 [Bacteriovoracaceae bacterium]|nr:hypothetical protein [Bacteriovoracaceae bacterium]
MTSKRKKDHLDLVSTSQTASILKDERFNYEPLLGTHPLSLTQVEQPFLGKKIKAPLWVSSMTGGTKMAGILNVRLARACKKFGMGMGLGSCRIFLQEKKYAKDFKLRSVIGDDLPFYANLGIAQVEQNLSREGIKKITEMIKNLEVDGLIIHINPLQEWLQPEGDRFLKTPLETLKIFLDKVSFPVVVKEVGHGFGPESLKSLWELPLQGIELAGFGGTNFSLLEIKRKSSQIQGEEALSYVGHSCEEMIEMIKQITSNNAKSHDLVISGGIKSFLDGHYLLSKLASFHHKNRVSAVYGQAYAFLEKAKISSEVLESFIEKELLGLQMARSFLRLKD